MESRATPLAPLLALAVLAGTSGCAPDASIQVQAICFPTDDCTFKSECDGFLIGDPVVDVDTGGVLSLVLQVSNQLPNNSDEDIWRVNTNDAHVDEAEIEFEGGATGIQEIPLNQWIPAGGTSVVGVFLGLGGAAASAAGTVTVAHLRMRGFFDDGTRFETGDFPIPVFVCSGCLPADPCAGAPACPGPGQLPVACGS